MDGQVRPPTASSSVHLHEAERLGTSNRAFFVARSTAPVVPVDRPAAQIISFTSLERDWYQSAEHARYNHGAVSVNDAVQSFAKQTTTTTSICFDRSARFDIRWRWSPQLRCFTSILARVACQSNSWTSSREHPDRVCW
jgi:hypothetical protein